MAKTYDGGCSIALQEQDCLARSGIKSAPEKATNSGLMYLALLRDFLDKFPILSGKVLYGGLTRIVVVYAMMKNTEQVHIRIDLLLFRTCTIKLLFRSRASDRIQFAAGEFLFQLRHLSNDVFGWCPYDKFHLFQIARSDNCRSYAFAP